MARVTIINTPKFINRIPTRPGGNIATNSAPRPSVQQPIAPPAEDIKDKNVRVKIIRYLDDGRQTLGIMQVYNKDGTEKFELKSVELPYLGNKNSISCIPPGKYLVRSRTSDHYGKHFWIIGQEENNYKFNKLIGEGYTRSAVLIHKGPNSTWLAGCIGPGTKFNSRVYDYLVEDKYGAGGKAGNKKGNPYGVISKKDSQLGLNKLVNTLWSSNSKDTWYLIIENSPTLTSLASPATLNSLGINPVIGT